MLKDEVKKFEVENKFLSAFIELSGNYPTKNLKERKLYQNHKIFILLKEFLERVRPLWYLEEREVTDELEKREKEKKVSSDLGLVGDMSEDDADLESVQSFMNSLTEQNSSLPIELLPEDLFSTELCKKLEASISSDIIIISH